MADNVFGNPITDSTLKELHEYADKAITRLDRANMAILLKNAENKDFNARTYVEKLKEEWGIGDCTLVLLYNATGDTVMYAQSSEQLGELGPIPYPTMIQNGQWGAFLHMKISGLGFGSSGAVVYRGWSVNDDRVEWMMAWSNPWDDSPYNVVYTEIREAHFYETANWNDVYNNMNRSNVIQWADHRLNCSSIVSIGRGNTVVYEGVMMTSVTN